MYLLYLFIYHKRSSHKKNCESSLKFVSNLFVADSRGDYPRKCWKSTLNRCGKGRVIADFFGQTLCLLAKPVLLHQWCEKHAKHVKIIVLTSDM